MLEDLTGGDTTWQRAFDIASRKLKVPSHVWSLLRNAWSGASEPAEFVRGLGFLKVSAGCLVNAAEINLDGKEPTIEDVQRAITLLGLRPAAVIVAVNYACSVVLKDTPPPRLWRPLFEEMMTSVQIGYQFGTKADGVGPEGGMLMGFAKAVGNMLLLSESPEVYARWVVQSRGYDSAELMISHFGCQAFQVGAFVLQQLGFGTEVAIGVALAVGNLRHELITVDSTTTQWKSACYWVEALRQGQSYPRDVGSRGAFPALDPTKGGADPGSQLRALYSEIGRIRRDNSAWLWHLPKPSYEETESLVNKWKSEKEAKKTGDKKTSRAAPTPPAAIRFYQ